MLVIYGLGRQGEMMVLAVFILVLKFGMAQI